MTGEKRSMSPLNYCHNKQPVREAFTENWNLILSLFNPFLDLPFDSSKDTGAREN